VSESKEFWCVKTEIFKDGTFDISMSQRNCVEKPLFSQQIRFEIEIYKDWFETQAEAEDFIEKKTRLCRDKLAKETEGEKHKSRPIRGNCLLTAAEVARRLTVSAKEVYNMTKQNVLCPHRIQGVIRYDSADIDDYLFFSKFHDNYIHLKRFEAKEFLDRLNARIEDQITHTKNYIEEFVTSQLKRRQT
jgi:hypothetical protein